MTKDEFLDIVSKFDRNEFKSYLYKSENKKQKLVIVLELFDKNNNVIEPVIPNEYQLYCK